MTGNFTISVDRQSLEIDNNFHNEKIVVSVDNDNTNNSFIIDDTYNAEWVTVKRQRNVLYLLIKNNYDVSPRSTSITLKHICDPNIFAYISIVQQGELYQISLNKLTDSNIFLKQYFDDDKNFEDRKIKIDVKGGREQFYIKKVKQFTGNKIEYIDNDNNEQEYEEECEYDNGLSLTAINEKNNCELIIRNYGRTFVDEENYYVITLAHKDKKDEIVNITVKYEQYNRVLSLYDFPSECDNKQNITKIEFNSVGKSKTDNKTAYIDFGKCVDYGYVYDINGDVDEINKWLFVDENPTSLTFNVSLNYWKERSASIVISSRDDEDTNKQLLIKQEGAENKIDFSQTSIIAPHEGISDGTLTVYVYGAIREKTKKLSCNDSRFTIAEIEYDNFDNRLYDAYNVTYQISPNGSSDSIKKEITFTYGTITNNIELNQRGSITSETKEDPSISDNKITVILSTENSNVVCSTSARWCTFAFKNEGASPVVEIKCEKNLFDLTRYCRIIITNAEKTDENWYFTLTQPKGETFNIKYEG